MRSLLVLSACIATVASAQPPDKAPPTPPPLTLEQQQLDDPSRAVIARKRESIAVALSWGSTLGGLGLMIGALYGAGHTRTTLTAASISVLWIGPTTGHLYLEAPWTRGLRTRLIGTAVMVGGTLLHLRYRSGQDTEMVRDIGTTMLVAGALTYLGGMGEELYDAGVRVRRAKARTRLLPVAGGGPGMTLVASF